MAQLAYPSLPLSSLAGAIARARGWVPSALNDDDLAALRARLRERLNEAWRWGAWPKWSPVERIDPVAEWDAVTAYADQAKVWYSPTGQYYQATAAVSAGTEPPAAPWTPISAPATYDIDTVFDVYLADPRDNPRARRVQHVSGAWGVAMPRQASSSPVWVHYRVSPPVIADSPWTAAAGYTKGAVVLHADDSWMAESATATTDVPGVSPLWVKQVFPTALADALTHLVAGDLLIAAGQMEQGGYRVNLGTQSLVNAYEREIGQSRVMLL